MYWKMREGERERESGMEREQCSYFCNHFWYFQEIKNGDMFFGKSVIISEKFGSVPHLYKSFIKTNTKNIFEFDEAFFENSY